MNKKLKSKFAKAAGACLLGVTLLTGCAPSPAEQAAQAHVAAEQAQGYRTYPDACVVVDLQPGYPYQSQYESYANTYDFRNGILLINTGNDGSMYRSATSVAISDLNQSGKRHAQEMFDKLPPSAQAKCEAPIPAAKPVPGAPGGPAR
ncbi:MAG: hypothetical protein GC185_07235 [Alphaproteobacteria bacterium]|nr:hypothetical protein [Alphaproteobacteria bacterium]